MTYQDDYSDGSLEGLMPYGTYLRQAMIYREAQLAKTFSVTSKYILPKNVMLHLFTNFSHKQHEDGIHMGGFPFLTDSNNLQYVKHLVDFNELPSSYRKLFPSRIRRSNLRSNLTAWDKVHRKVSTPVRQYRKLIDNPNAVLISNYNPLFRLKVNSTNPLHMMHHFETLFSVMLAKVSQYTRNHFLVLEVTDNITLDYQRITAINNAGKFAKAFVPESDTYFSFVFLHLALLLEDQSSRVSIFHKIPHNSLRFTNLLLIRGDKCIAINMATLLELAADRTKAKRFLNGIVSLSQSSLKSPVLSPVRKGVSEVDKVPELGDAGYTTDPEDTSSEPGEIEGKSDEGIAKESTHEVEDLFEEPQEVSNDSYTPKYQLPKAKIATITHVDTAALDSVTEEFIDVAEVSEDQKKRALTKTSAKYKKIKLNDGKTIAEVIDEKVDLTMVVDKAEILSGKMVDDNMLESTTEKFDEQYLKKQFKKDILTNLVAFQANGLFISNFKEEEELNEFTRVNHTTVSFEDIHGKKHTVKFKYPIPDKDGYMLVNGVKLAMTKQMVNVPICKVSPTRVSLISNYNKTLVERVTTGTHSLVSLLAKKADKFNVKLSSIDQSFLGMELPYEYKQLGRSYGTISTDRAVLVFDYKNRFTQLKLDEKTLAPLEKKYGVCMGKMLRKPYHLFMNQNNRITSYHIKDKQLMDGNIRLPDLIHDDFTSPMEWCHLKILDKNIPIIFVLAYRFGLSKVLDYLKISYRFIPSGGKKDMKSSEISVKFKDGSLVFSRYPLVSSLILSGLRYYNSLKLYTLDTMDDSNIYYQLLMDKGMSINYLKGIDNHFTFFIDPITRDILEGMNEPTNTKDLLIRAVEMLVYSKEIPPASMENFRVRSYEKIPATIYNEISRQYANYVNSNYKDSSFSINTEAIFQRIIQDQTVTLKEEINPIHAIKEKNKITYTGFGGRTAESFVERDRQFPTDGLGILSEATVDSGSVALNAFLSPNANITNLRGRFEVNGDIDSTNSLSTVTQLLPFSTNDD